MNDNVYHRKLAKALGRMGGLYTLNDILERVATGNMQSHVVNNSWAITQVIDFPRRRVLDIIVAVGDLDDILALHEVVIGYASIVNASLVRAFGRPGWGKFAEPHGWRLANNVYYKEM